MTKIQKARLNHGHRGKLVAYFNKVTQTLDRIACESYLRIEMKDVIV